MTKAELMALFPNFSPKRAFREGDDGWELVGKYVNVAWVTNTWDVFIFGSTKRTNLLVADFPPGVFRKVADDGEAWWQSEDIELVRDWLEKHRARLGLAKRRLPPPKNATEALKNATRMRLARPRAEGPGSGRLTRARARGFRAS